MPGIVSRRSPAAGASSQNQSSFPSIRSQPWPRQPPLRFPLWKYPESANGNNPLLLHVTIQSVLQIDVEVEEPETSENPTQSFEIQNIIWRGTQLLAVIIYTILYRYLYNMISFRCRASGLPPEHPECSRIFTEHGQKLYAPPDDIMNPSHCDTSTVNTLAWYRGRRLLRATPPPSTLTRLKNDFLVITVKHLCIC